MNHISETTTALDAKLQALRDKYPEAHPLPQRGQCRPDCQVCGGSGLVRLDVPPDDFRFGKLQPCPNLPARNTEGRYGLLVEEQDYTWSGIEYTDQSVERAVGAVRNALEGWASWVYLWGGYGTAKTLILKTAIAECLRHEKHAVYVRMVDLLDDLRAAYDDDKSMASIIERVYNWTTIPVLAIDEIDRFKQTEWADERVFQIIDRRYSGAEVGRTVTLIASNSRPEALDGYFTSRVRDGRFTVVQLTGPDYRPAMERREPPIDFDAALDRGVGE